MIVSLQKKKKENNKFIKQNLNYYFFSINKYYIRFKINLAKFIKCILMQFFTKTKKSF